MFRAFIIGDTTETVLQRFLTIIPHRLSVGQGKVMFDAVLVNVDDNSGKAVKIDRIHQEIET